MLIKQRGGNFRVWKWERKRTKGCWGTRNAAESGTRALSVSLSLSPLFCAVPKEKGEKNYITFSHRKRHQKNIENVKIGSLKNFLISAEKSLFSSFFLSMHPKWAHTHTDNAGGMLRDNWAIEFGLHESYWNNFHSCHERRIVKMCNCITSRHFLLLSRKCLRKSNFDLKIFGLISLFEIDALWLCKWCEDIENCQRFSKYIEFSQNILNFLKVQCKKIKFEKEQYGKEFYRQKSV